MVCADDAVEPQKVGHCVAAACLLVEIAEGLAVSTEYPGHGAASVVDRWLPPQDPKPLAPSLSCLRQVYLTFQAPR